MSSPQRGPHSRFRRWPGPLFILQELSTPVVIYKEETETTMPSSVAEGRLQVRPENHFTAEALHPRAQAAAITREDCRAGARLEPRSTASPGALSRPMWTLEKSSRVPQSCVSRHPRTPTPGPAAGGLEKRTSCWLHPGLQKQCHLPNMASASPAVGTAAFTSAATATLSLSA